MLWRPFHALPKQLRFQQRSTVSCARFYSAMGDSGDSSESNAGGKNAAPNNGMKEVRILMIHGYTQSGPNFRAKTRALEKPLRKALAPLGLSPTLVYPTAPHRLSAADVPGFSSSAADGPEAEAESDSWAWFRKDDATGSYRGLDEGMRRLAETMGEAVASSGSASSSAEGNHAGQEDTLPPAGWGGIDGVIGFSQGGSMAAMLASAMETLTDAPAVVGQDGGDLASKDQCRRIPPEGDWSWLPAVRAANANKPLRFAVIYSGFFAPPKELSWLYDPPIRTPTLHFIGGLDTVVDESRSQGLVERCADPVVVVHPGGHYVPISRQWLVPLVGFIQKCVSS